MEADEATQLIRQGLRGTGRDLTFSILDLGPRSDWLDTQFMVTYRTRNPTPQFREGYTYETRYSGRLSQKQCSKLVQNINYAWEISPWLKSISRAEWWWI